MLSPRSISLVCCPVTKVTERVPGGLSWMVGGIFGVTTLYIKGFRVY